MIYLNTSTNFIGLQRQDKSFNLFPCDLSFMLLKNNIHHIDKNYKPVGPTMLTEWEKEDGE